MSRFPAFRSMFLVCAAVLIGAASMVPEDAKAVPAFARQTGMACVACHNQAFPALNSFGRMFKANGYTMVGGQSLIEGEHISLPMALNMSAVAKIRYAKTNGNTDTGTDHGQIQWPDEAAFLVGGKVADKVGFLMEIGMAGIATPVEVDMETGEGEGEGIALLSSKLHFNVAEFGGSNFSIVPFSTDGLGVGYGFELLNTGAQRAQRPIEYRTGFSAAQALEVGSGAATGMSFVLGNNNYFVSYTPWTPGFNGDNFDVSVSGLAHYFRAVYMPHLFGFDTGFGIQLWAGDSEVADADGERVTASTDAWVIDAQALGEIAEMPLSLYASYGSTKGGDDSIWNDNPNDAKAFAMMGQLGVLPNRANVYLAYRTMDSGADDDSRFNAVTLGGQYLYSQNLRFELFHVIENGSGVDMRATERDSMTMIQLFAGF